MLKVDLSNVWGDLSLPDLLATEQEVFAAHKTLAEGRGPGNDFLGWLELPTFEETEELQRIVMRSAALLGIEIDPAGAREIASRSRGTPRIANRLLRRVRDFAQVCHDGVITTEAADHALGKLEVDKLGLDAIDRRMLTAIIRSYGGGPVGLETLAATIGEEAVTLEDVYEPYLLQIGFLTRTPRGRCVTQLAYEHLHLPSPVQPAGTQLSF